MNQKLIEGNCLEKLKEIDNEVIHLTFTSPPYFNAKSYSSWPSYDDYLKFLHDVFVEVERVTKEGRICAVNISPVIIPRKSRKHESKRLPIPFHFFKIMEDIGWKYIDDIVWSKPEGSSINRNGGFFQHRKPVAYKPNIVTETIFIFKKRSKYLIDKVLRSYPNEMVERSLVLGKYERSNIWKINPETRSKHPAPFPEELSDRIVRYYSFVGDNVLDPFVGSGTTLVSCKKFERNGIGIEIHNEYIEMANERLGEDGTDLFFE